MSNTHHEHRDDKPDPFEPDEQPKSLLRELGEDAVAGARFTFRVALVTAAIGAVVGGGFGVWSFGLQGFLIGAAVGAVLGGALGVWIVVNL